MEANEDYNFLKQENERLLDENQKLRFENTELKEQIQKYEAHLFDSGVSDSRNVTPSIGNEAFCVSKNSVLIENSLQLKKAIISPEEDAHYVNSKQIQVIIYDYVDYLVPVLERMYYKRLKGYKRIGYSCRTQVDSGAKNTAMIYDQNEFVSVFDEDLGKNYPEIVISSPYVSRMRVEAIIGIIQRKGANYCRIRIMTRPANDYPTEIQGKIAVSISRLESVEINVIQTAGLLSKFAVIDQAIVWFGDVDFLSKSKEDAFVLRFENREVAKELIKRVGL